MAVSVYNVHAMKRYTVSSRRQHLAQALDEVAQGDPVVVERRGKKFRIVSERERPARAAVRPFFELGDRSLLETGWTWEWVSPGKAPVFRAL